MPWVSEKGFHHVESEKLFRLQTTQSSMASSYTLSPQQITFPGPYKAFLVNPGPNPISLTPIQALSTTPPSVTLRFCFPKDCCLKKTKGQVQGSFCGALWVFLTNSPSPQTPQRIRIGYDFWHFPDRKQKAAKLTGALPQTNPVD